MNSVTERLLEIQNLDVIYETDEETVYAVNDLSLSVYKGETLGLVGETGAGKTTLALSIMKLLPERTGRILKGSIHLEEFSVTEMTEADMRALRGDMVSMIFQDPMTSLNPIHPIGKQIAEMLLLHKKQLSTAQIEERVDQILTMVGISPDRKGDFPHQFSGGMKQRVVIAIALACEPQLLLADEPTTALDVTIQAQVLQMMKKLKDDLGTSMILITHDLGVVARTCDRVAIMYAGEIVETGRVENLFQGDYHHPYTVALFGSIPNLTKKTKRLQAIEGLMPDPTALPAGCKFHPRCPRCMDICQKEAPGAAVREGHQVRCHLYAEAAKD